ncbi:MAG: hypothetical protein HQL08_09225 [Nitrospirae bacterium]|nr:hypothetical protein [Nitrospirota bacterium]
MEKKLLSNASADQVQPYTLKDFDEHAGIVARPFLEGGESVPMEEQISEEQRVGNLEQEARKRGFDQGRSDGYAEGLESGKNEVNATIGKLGEIIVSLDKFRENKLDELLPEVIGLSIEIAKRIVHKEIDLDRNLILSVAEDAIRKAGNKDEEIVIKVSPLDYEVMITQIDHLKEQAGIKNITIEPSSAISPGGCYIETPSGEVDARLEEQVKEVEDAIATATHRKM